MTDNEIIKALECMTGISCNDCRYSHEDCGDRIKDVEELVCYDVTDEVIANETAESQETTESVAEETAAAEN